MGMLFNTDATVEMVATINDEFSKAKKKAVWKPRRQDFDPPKKLHEIARKHRVHPSKGGPGARARWYYWLDKILDSTLSDQLAYPTGAQSPYPYPPVNANSFVGVELQKLLAIAIEDDLCEEIVVVVQPDTKVYVSQAQRLPLIDPPGQYALVITLNTVEIPPNVAALSEKRRK